MSHGKDAQVQLLKAQYENIQKKTFTKWMNSMLRETGGNVEELFEDLKDGVALLNVLRVLTKENVPLPSKPAKGKPMMRFHKVENVEKALKFINERHKLESIGGQDIVEGNGTLTLGLIWTIILRFQIAEVEVEGDDAKSAKEALLRWCQRKTAGYRGVNIENFTTSWRDGLAFNAIIHKHRPDLIDFNSLDPKNARYNLQSCFEIAERELGLVALLDVDDVMNMPDEKSIMTYLIGYYHQFVKMEQDDVWRRRLQNAMQLHVQLEKEETTFELNTGDLLDWLTSTIKWLQDRNFPNQLPLMQEQMQRFKDYRTREKPLQFVAKGNIEATVFDIQVQRRSGNRRLYSIPIGKELANINNHWAKLEKEEHERELALRAELRRLEHLENLASNFDRKARLREEWIDEMLNVLKIPDFGASLASVVAAQKKEDTSNREIQAYAERLKVLSSLERELKAGAYYNAGGIAKELQAVTNKWQELQALTEKRRKELTELYQLYKARTDMDDASAFAADLAQQLAAGGLGKDIDEVEELIEKHNRLATDYKARRKVAEDAAANAVANFNKNKHSKTAELEKRRQALLQQLAEVQNQVDKRSILLAQSLAFQKFLRDVREEESWIRARMPLVCSTDVGNTLNATQSAQRKHQALQIEMTGHPKAGVEALSKQARQLIDGGSYAADDIQAGLNHVKTQWEDLLNHAAQRKTALDVALLTQHFYVDANEAESWLIEREPVAQDRDLGRDEHSAQHLLQKHKLFVLEVEAYKAMVADLDKQSKAVVQAPKPKALTRRYTSVFDSSLAANANNAALVAAAAAATTVSSSSSAAPESTTAAPPFQTQPQAQTASATAAPTPAAPAEKMVKVKHDYKGTRAKELSVTKGEVLKLVNDKDDNWWKVSREDGSSGYVPAKYVKLLEPAELPPTTVAPAPAMVATATTTPTPTTTNPASAVGSSAPISLPRHLITTSTPTTASEPIVYGDLAEKVSQRQAELAKRFAKLQQDATQRTRFLEDSVVLFNHENQCAEVLAWLRETEPIFKSADLGNNLEQIELINSTFQKFLNEKAPYGIIVEKLRGAAKDMVAAKHTQAPKVVDRQNMVDQAWKDMERIAAARAAAIADRLDVCRFQRDAEDTQGWMREKQAVMPEDLGRDLNSVQALQRQHEAFLQDVLAIEGRTSTLEDQADALMVTHASDADRLDSTKKTVAQQLVALREQAQERLQRLDAAYRYQEAMADFRAADTWLNSLQDEVKAVDLPHDVASAEAVLEHHRALKNEIDARREAYQALSQRAEDLAAKGHYAAPELAAQAEALKQQIAAMDVLWAKRNKEFAQCLDLRRLESMVDRANGNFDRQEAVLRQREVGDSVDAADLLLKSHADFLTRLQAHKEDVVALIAEAERMLEGEGHYAGARVADLRDKTMGRRLDIEAAAERRQQELKASVALQALLRDIAEAKDWMADRQSRAADRNYLDKVNLKSKQQAHARLEMELESFDGQMEALRARGAELMAARNAGARRVQQELDDINAAWEVLLATAADKGQKLKETVQEQDYVRGAADFDAWCEEIEQALKNTELGADRIQASTLLRHHQQLAADVAGKAEVVASIEENAEALIQAGNYEASAIDKRRQGILNRYKALEIPVSRRMATLDASVKLQVFLSNQRNEMSWIQEREPRARSTDTGHDLPSAQALYAQHKKFAGEVTAHGDLVSQVVQEGRQLAKGGHYAFTILQQEAKALEEAYNRLVQACNQRMELLRQACEAQQLMVDATEAANWCQGTVASASHTDYGEVPNQTDVYRARHDVLRSDIAAHAILTAALVSRSQQLKAAGNHQADQAAAVVQEAVKAQRSLEAAATQRQQLLQQRHELHQLRAAVTDTCEWMQDRLQVALITDIGPDQEGCEALRARFEDFCRDVASHETERVKSLAAQGQALLAAKHADQADITAELGVLQEGWQQLQASIEARRQQLDSAHEVHSFVREADELSLRINEKAAIASNTDVGRDVSSVNALARSHEIFEHDVKALEPLVAKCEETGMRLGKKYPNSAEVIVAKASQVAEAWERLQEKTRSRQAALNASQQLQSFLSQQRYFDSWMEDQMRQICSFEAASDVSRAEADLTVNRGYKAEVDARQDVYNALCQFGERLLREQPNSASEVTVRLAELRETFERLHDTWGEVQHALETQRDVLQFQAESEAAHAWLASRDTLLATAHEDGQSDLQSLMLKHAELEASVSAQEARFMNLRRLTQQESETLDKSAADAYRRRFQVEDETTLAEQAEKERARQESHEAYRRRMAEMQEQQRRQEEEERRRRAEQAAQAAKENEARAKELANAILDRDRRRSAAYEDALKQARKEAAQKLEEQKRQQQSRAEREQRAHQARQRAQQAVEEVRALQASDDFLPTPSSIVPNRRATVGSGKAAGGDKLNGREAGQAAGLNGGSGGGSDAPRQQRASMVALGTNGTANNRALLTTRHSSNDLDNRIANNNGSNYSSNNNSRRASNGAVPAPLRISHPDDQWGFEDGETGGPPPTASSYASNGRSAGQPPLLGNPPSAQYAPSMSTASSNGNSRRGSQASASFESTALPPPPPAGFQPLTRTAEIVPPPPVIPDDDMPPLPGELPAVPDDLPDELPPPMPPPEDEEEVEA